MPTTLGYGDIHGLAHAIRLLLEYTDSSYKEKKYMMGDSPNYDRGHNAILCHIARKHNLCGETEEEKIRVDILENQSMDNLMQLAMICYIPEFEKVKPKYLEELPEKLTLYSQFLGKRPWFAGDEITFVDFLAYDILDLNCIFEPSCLDVFPNLKDFISRFEGLKKISAYMKSSQCLQGPLFGKSAMPGSLENTGEQPDSLDPPSFFLLVSTLFSSPRPHWLPFF
uniref:glutathione transferase n=1 Tax=Cercocebus atys TaxID=9531 RepID=A0A2K5KWT2_CERAT